MNSQSNTLNLRSLWNALIEIYKVFDAICQKHNLVHYVAFGTLLGAMRHKGFIPWDDDFDVMMPREDYDAFMNIKSELPEYLKWVSIETDSEHGLLFAKIIDKREEVVSNIKKDTGCRLQQGVFLDIFPMDGLPHNTIAFQLWRIKRSFLRRYRSKYELQKWCKSRPYSKSRFVGVANSGSSKMKKIVYDKLYFGTPKRISFENIMVNIPENADAILTIIYGDWRTLPPENERHPAHQ